MPDTPHDFAGLERALQRAVPLENILVALVDYHDSPMRHTFTPFQQAALSRARRDIAMALQSIEDGHEV